MRKSPPYELLLTLLLVLVIISLITPRQPLAGLSSQVAQVSITVIDVIPPKLRNQSQQYEILPQNMPNNLSVECWDNDKLGYALLSTNESGQWVNWTDTPFNFSGESRTWATASFLWENGSLPIGTVVGWRIWCYDVSGNVNGSGVKTFSIGAADISPPTIHWVSANPTKVYQGESIQFQAYVTDDNQVDSVWFEINGVNYTYTSRIGDLYFLDGISTIIPPGTYNFAVWANDSAGNIGGPKGGKFDIQVPIAPPPAVEKKVRRLYCTGKLDGPDQIRANLLKPVKVKINFTNTGSTLSSLTPSIETLPFSYSVQPAQLPSLGSGKNTSFEFTITPTQPGTFAANFKLSSREGCVFSKGFVLAVGRPAPPKIAKLKIDGQPRICAAWRKCSCEKFGNWTRILEVGQFIARIENVGQFELENLSFELDVPEGWQVDGPRTFSSLKPGQALEVSWRVIPATASKPYIENVLLRVRSRGQIIASRPFKIEVRLPDFAVLPEPSLTPAVGKDKLKIYVIVNNKYGLTAMEGLHAEFTLDDCVLPHSLLADLVQIGDLKRGELFLKEYEYQIEPLRPRVYNIHGVLYSKGVKIDESHRLLDLRPKKPIKLLFTLPLLYMLTIVVIVTIIWLGIRKLRRSQVR